MIKDILDLLRMYDYYGESEIIDIAKGKYKYPKDMKEVKNMVKRRTKWLSKKQ